MLCCVFLTNKMVQQKTHTLKQTIKQHAFEAISSTTEFPGPTNWRWFPFPFQAIVNVGGWTSPSGGVFPKESLVGPLDLQSRGVKVNSRGLTVQVSASQVDGFLGLMVCGSWSEVQAYKVASYPSKKISPGWVDKRMNGPSIRSQVGEPVNLMFFWKTSLNEYNIVYFRTWMNTMPRSILEISKWIP